MVQVQYGGKEGQSQTYEISPDCVVVRSYDRSPVLRSNIAEATPMMPETLEVLSQFQVVSRFPDAGVEVLCAKSPQADETLRDTARGALKAEPNIQFAGRVLVDPIANQPVVYTENLFVKFHDDEDVATCEALLQREGLTVKRQLDYAANAYFVSAPAGTGLAVFEIADRLLQEEAVEFCHPELVSELRKRKAFPDQWHLKPTTIRGQAVDASANVESAWELGTGAGITIAIIDDGVDLEHEEFRSANKIVAPRDVTRQSDNPRPVQSDNHGTACAGVACANGNFGASGVAPAARLMPIRFVSALGSQAEADAFVWAARNGADVISCSWGPPDGRWFDPNDPLHNQVVPLPDSTRLAIDFAINNGRNGKGCVILFAAGNGNESVDNDGYASYKNVIAVAACNDKSQRSAYSDFGKAVWCCFPSSDGRPSLTPGIWTTDRSGRAGYNIGNERQGDVAGNYTNSFGGTSSACPGAAGVAALILGRNPNLRWDQAREILRQSCDPIDQANGQYDAAGRSPFYGYGRLNARQAMELAVPPQPNPARIYRVVQDVPIPDLGNASLGLTVADSQVVKSIKVTVEVEHTYIGDLVITLSTPLPIEPILLHNRLGGGTRNLKKIYDRLNAPGLAAVEGQSAQGSWSLAVVDRAAQDAGKIRSLTIEIEAAD
ncbi:MAG: S8 family serine peptidase [Elainella sp. Prado103]|jgi:subtilisin family serine protease|nr:S8 family serine peptidase [Elainella sp. Prado103]